MYSPVSYSKSTPQPQGAGYVDANMRVLSSDSGMSGDSFCSEVDSSVCDEVTTSDVEVPAQVQWAQAQVLQVQGKAVHTLKHSLLPISAHTRRATCTDTRYSVPPTKHTRSYVRRAKGSTTNYVSEAPPSLASLATSYAKAAPPSSVAPPPLRIRVAAPTETGIVDRNDPPSPGPFSGLFSDSITFELIEEELEMSQPAAASVAGVGGMSTSTANPLSAAPAEAAASDVNEAYVKNSDDGGEPKRQRVDRPFEDGEQGSSASDRPVMVCDPTTGAGLHYFSSSKHITSRLGLPVHEILGVCFNRKRIFAGFTWRFATPAELEPPPVTIIKENELKRRLRIHAHEWTTGGVLTERSVVVLDRISGRALRYMSTMKEAATQLNIPINNLLTVCQHGKKSYKGFGWRYASADEQVQGRVPNEVSEAEVLRMLREHESVPLLGDRPIVALDRVTSVPLRYFTTMKGAAAQLGIAKDFILKVCQNRRESCKGFGWRYARPEEIEQGRVYMEVSEEEMLHRLQMHVPHSKIQGRWLDVRGNVVQ